MPAHYINGQWIQGKAHEQIDVYNSYTGEVIKQIPQATNDEVDKAVEVANEAFKEWRNTTKEERAKYVKQIRDGIERNKETLANIITQELGATKRTSLSGQVEKSCEEMDCLLEAFKDYSFEETLENALVVKEPYGVVSMITPWNYPLNQIQRKLTPALLAGNTVVVHPSSKTPLAAIELARIIDEETDLPKGVFNLVLGRGGTSGDYLAKHPKTQVVSFTGSTKVGSNMYESAKNQIKQLVLELGGKSAMLLLEDGDIDLAVETTLNMLLGNVGQTCTVLSRLFVPESLKETVYQKIIDFYENEVVLGDPADEKTTLGPLIDQNQKERVEKYIETGLKEGARRLVGQAEVDLDGPFVDLTVFVDVTNDMKIAQEEIFGPVLSVITYDDLQTAIDEVNDSDYGLSGAVVGPKEQATKVARQLETGLVSVNDGRRNSSAPMGGHKLSGLGQEVGIYSLEDYLQTKSIFL